MKHFKTLNIHHTDGSRKMERATYYGFAIGAESHHVALEINLGGNSHVVMLGAPLVLEEPFTGAPLITPIVRTTLQVVDDYEAGDELNNWQSKVHVMGLTCKSELGLSFPEKLEPIAFRFTPSGNSAGEATVASIPFIGRKQAIISYDATVGAEQLTVYDGTHTMTNLTGLEDSRLDTQEPSTIGAALATATTDSHLAVEDLPSADVIVLKMANGGEASFAANIIVRVY